MHKIIGFTKKYKVFLLIGVLLASAFYWYGWRPTQIKKECFAKAKDFSYEAVGDKGSIDEFNKAYDFLYKNCLRKKGL